MFAYTTINYVSDLPTSSEYFCYLWELGEFLDQNFFTIHYKIGESFQTRVSLQSLLKMEKNCKEYPHSSPLLP